MPAGDESRPRVLVLGGGYVALEATRRLARLVRSGAAEVTVVTRHNSHVYHGFIGEMITGRVGPSVILNPARRIFAPAEVHVGEIEGIDLEQRRVATTRLLDGRPYELEYDHLVLGLGSEDRLDVYPGLAEHAFRLKSFAGCLRLRNHLLNMFELAELEPAGPERARLLTFVVAGGGYAGTEIAGELADFARRLTRRSFRRIRQEESRVVLVHPGGHLLPELYSGGGAAGYGHGHPRLADYAEKHLRRLGVEVLADTTLAWAGPQEVGLSDGRRISTRTVVSAVGTKMVAVLEKLELERDRRGRILTDAGLMARGRENVWAGGDCAAVAHPAGGTCPPSAIYAMRHGRLIGANIAAVIGGREKRPFRYAGIGQAASIGNRTAVGELRGIEFTGLPAWLLWRAILFYYLPSWDRRLRALGDWLLWPLAGRDIAELTVTDPAHYDIRHAVFEAGETILAGGEATSVVYLVLEGEVEALGGDEANKMGPGERFGHLKSDPSLAISYRARTRVGVLMVRADQVQRLVEMAALAVK